MLELKGIDKYYNIGTINEMCLFDGFDLTIDDGQFVSVVGSNGSGKTSMLNIICGSIDTDGGRIVMNGQDITNKKEFKRYDDIGRVYQDPSMGTCPAMTILENMAIADNKGKSYNLRLGIQKSRIDYYKELLSRLNLGLEDKLHVKVGALSGGQRQAMSLLMATMTKPRLLLLDEHTAALDPKTAQKVLELTEKIIKDDKLTALMVTHNMRDALKLGNRLIMMNTGKVAVDVQAGEKEGLHVADLLKLFEKASGGRGISDRMLLS